MIFIIIYLYICTLYPVRHLDWKLRRLKKYFENILAQILDRTEQRI